MPHIVIIFFSLALIFGIYNIRSWIVHKDREHISYFFTSLVITFVIFIIFCMMNYSNVGYNLFYEKIEDKTYYYPIYSMNNKSEIQGSFTFGSGRIDEVDYYVVLIKGEHGYLKHKIDYTNNTVYLKNTNNLSPRVQTIKSVYKSKFTSEITEEEEYKVIIIPENSIQETYTIW